MRSSAARPVGAKSPPPGPGRADIPCVEAYTEAAAYRAVFVTHNMAEFSRMPGLDVENWQR